MQNTILYKQYVIIVHVKCPIFYFLNPTVYLYFNNNYQISVIINIDLLGLHNVVTLDMAHVSTRTIFLVKTLSIICLHIDGLLIFF